MTNKLKISLVLAVIFASSLHATIGSVSAVNTTMKIGESKAVLQFTVTSTTVTQLYLKNTSTAVPFGSAGVERIYISNSASGLDNMGLGHTFTSGQGNGQLYAMSVSLVPATYYVCYKISKYSSYSESESSKVISNIELTAYDDTNSANVTGSLGGSQSIAIWPSGLIAVSSSFAGLASSQNIGPGLSDIPILKFALRAIDTTVNVSQITIVNQSSNFAKNSSTAATGVRRVRLLRALTFGGTPDLSADKIELASITLPDATQDQGTLTITFNPVTISPVSVTSSNAKDGTFYVLYDIGPGIAPGATISCALTGADGDTPLSGSLPGPQIYTIQDTNLLLNSVTIPTHAHGDVYLAGCRGVRMLNINLSAFKPITNATVRINNEYASFGRGVERVSLYLDGATPVLVASTSTFPNHAYCDLANVNFPQQDLQNYYIEYDLGNKTTLYQAFANLNTITSGNVLFAGNVPAPSQSAEVVVTLGMLSIESITLSATEIVPGRTFLITVGITKNVAGPAILSKADCRPRFYANSIEGQDISSEYVSYTEPGTIDLGAAFSTAIITFNVTAQSLKTNGPVVVDIQLGYSSSLYVTINAIMQKYVDGNTTYPAAWDRMSLVSRTQVISVSGADTSTASQYFPAHIASVHVKQDIYDTNPRRFVNNDLVAKDTLLVISFANAGADIDKPSIIFKKDGIVLHPVTEYDFNETTGVITLKTLGSTDAKYTLDCTSGGAQMPTVELSVRISGGIDPVSVKELYGYPNPYNPDDGNCRIGFEVNQACKYTVRIYDASGVEILSEKDLNAIIGYNYYSWDGTRKSGAKVGRGVYVVVIEAKGTTTTRVRTKVGVQ